MILALPRRANETARRAVGAHVVLQLLERRAKFVTQRFEPRARFGFLLVQSHVRLSGAILSA
jgi:hypothetical protein